MAHNRASAPRTLLFLLLMPLCAHTLSVRSIHYMFQAAEWRFFADSLLNLKNLVVRACLCVCVHERVRMACSCVCTCACVCTIACACALWGAEGVCIGHQPQQLHGAHACLRRPRARPIDLAFPCALQRHIVVFVVVVLLLLFHMTFFRWAWCIDERCEEGTYRDVSERGTGRGRTCAPRAQAAAQGAVQPVAGCPCAFAALWLGVWPACSIVVPVPPCVLSSTRTGCETGGRRPLTSCGRCTCAACCLPLGTCSRASSPSCCPRTSTRQLTSRS